MSTPSGGNVDITSAANLIVLHQQVNAPGLFEAEIGRRIEHYGNVAQVRSVSVARSTADGPVNERYVNCYQLYWEGSRWWIASIVWDEECPSAPIPKAWIGSWEEVGQTPRTAPANKGSQVNSPTNRPQEYVK